MKNYLHSKSTFILLPKLKQIPRASILNLAKKCCFKKRDILGSGKIIKLGILFIASTLYSSGGTFVSIPVK